MTEDEGFADAARIPIPEPYAMNGDVSLAGRKLLRDGLQHGQ
jgi:hypothetical protein